MSMETYDDTCSGCRPAIVDVATGKIMPQDSPVMQIVNQLFNKLTPTERQAWHDFTCKNSRDPKTSNTLAGSVARWKPRSPRSRR